jgi:hypothetical protein
MGGDFGRKIVRTGFLVHEYEYRISNVEFRISNGKAKDSKELYIKRPMGYILDFRFL